MLLALQDNLIPGPLSAMWVGLCALSPHGGNVGCENGCLLLFLLVLPC